MKVLLSVILILCFVSSVHAELSSNSSIYDEKNLTKQLKGNNKEEVLKVLGEPAVKKPSEESNESLGYWWYNMGETGIFVYFRDGKVSNISVMTEEKRSKEI